MLPEKFNKQESVPKYSRNPATIDRDAKAAQYKASGMTLREIGDKLEVSHVAARQMIQRHYARNITEEFPELDRSEESATLEEIDAALSGIIANPQPAFSAAGKIIRDDDGEIVRDQSIQVRALAERRKLSESRRKLKAIDKQPEKMSYADAKAESDAYLAQTEADSKTGEWITYTNNAGRMVAMGKVDPESGQMVYAVSPQDNEGPAEPDYEPSDFQNHGPSNGKKGWHRSP